MHVHRFLCDEMLAELARWLRIAGYDAAQAERGLADRQILDQAIAEGRLMLTREEWLSRPASLNSP